MTEDTMQAAIERVDAASVGLHDIACWLAVNGERLHELSPHSDPHLCPYMVQPGKYVVDVRQLVPSPEQWCEAVRLLAEADPDAVKVGREANTIEAVRSFGAARFTVWIMANEFPFTGEVVEVVKARRVPLLEEILSPAASVIDWPHNPLTEFDGGDAA